MRIRLIPPLLLFTLLLACEPFAAPISGPALVIDGDSLEIGSISIRLFGVDAFEGRQSCRSNGGNWPCGESATGKLAELVGTGQLVCTKKDTDSYGRTVARCTAGTTDLAAELARAGLALAYRQYSNDYIDEEEEARAAGRGAWAGEFDAPWDWRRQGSRDSAESSAPGRSAETPSPVISVSDDCPIKGNISREGERIYHVPGSRYYDPTVIDESLGERWFCSAAEAERAGWRASRAR
jgi:endonuclease YncB( thermonuclease family)